MAENKQACNRKPFLSDSSCNRGDVDVHQFDELPYCDPVDPSKPVIPPNVEDDDIHIELPPPCACIDIKKGKIKMAAAGASSQSLAFHTPDSGTRDCCEGEYEMDLTIPCPIPKIDKPKKIKADVTFVVTKKKPPSSHSFFGKTSDNCEMPEPKDVDLNLELACPVRTHGKSKVRITTKFSKSPTPKSFVIASGNMNECSFRFPANQTVDLAVPCPVSNTRSGKIKVSAKYGAGFKAGSATYIKGNADSCTLEIPGQDPEIELEIPNQEIKFTGDTAKVDMTIKCGRRTIAHDVGDLVDLKAPLAPNAGKEIVAKTAALNLELKCPVRKVGDANPTIRMVGHLGNKKFMDSAKSFMRISEESCSVEATSAEFDFNVPCPIKAPNGHEITLKYNTSKTATVTKHLSLANVSKVTSECEITFNNATIDLTDIYIGSGGGSGGGLVPGSLSTADMFVTGWDYGYYSSDYQIRITKRRLKVTWDSKRITGLGATGSSSYMYIPTIPISQVIG